MTSSVVRTPRVLLPQASVDHHRWAVIACDQFTSQPDYWAEVEKVVGDAPSTLRMVFPELHLGAPDVAERVADCQATMRSYLDEGLLEPHEAIVYVERGVSGGTQRGLVVELDLEAYDFSPTATSAVRSTEGTVLDRLPPRMAVRRDAPLELPHILVLYDDPDGSVLAPVLAVRDDLEVAYDVDLMLGSGHLTGRLVRDPGVQQAVFAALDALVEPDSYSARYGLPAEHPLQFAMGDGNHSLATAKSTWEELKAAGAASDHPARWALVELVNLHDPSLSFEPIHRVLFDGASVVEDLVAALGATIRPADSTDDVLAAVASADGVQRFGIVTASGLTIAEIPDPTHQLAVGTLQAYLDAWLAERPDVEIDYVHGDDVTVELGRRPGNVGFLVPGIGKDAFFRSIAVDGPLPRKTFSLGHARDKRFYMEARAIR
ncbi:MAG: DUF1015 domain-containing protein [Propionibacteriaceae bacterium]|nr:DUF1015 domain-containing protein [Propionibacteriaceae bacterium]